jgi:hypothetical protein
VICYIEVSFIDSDLLYRDGVRVTLSLVLCVCFVDRCLSLCTFHNKMIS